MEAQEKQILEHLQKGYSLTPLEALQKYGCFRLGARIYDLKQKGYNIHTDTITAGKKRYAQYTMAEQTDLFRGKF